MRSRRAALTIYVPDAFPHVSIAPMIQCALRYLDSSLYVPAKLIKYVPNQANGKFGAMRTRMRIDQLIIAPLKVSKIIGIRRITGIPNFVKMYRKY